MLLKQRTLSPRQREALWYTAHGLTARQIGESMGCSEQTVKNHVHHMLRKLGASDRLAAAELCRPPRVVA